MRVIFIGLVFVCTIGLAGCSTIFGDNSRTVQVGSDPQGAQVYVNGMMVGSTPTTVAINSTFSPPLIMVKKRGYQDQMAHINTSFQSVGLLNIFIFIWPGFVIDAVSGNTMKIS